jgi:hypothetical protein
VALLLVRTAVGQPVFSIGVRRDEVCVTDVQADHGSRSLFGRFRPVGPTGTETQYERGENDGGGARHALPPGLESAA